MSHAALHANYKARIDQFGHILDGMPQAQQEQVYLKTELESGKNINLEILTLQSI